MEHLKPVEKRLEQYLRKERFALELLLFFITLALSLVSSMLTLLYVEPYYLLSLAFSIILSLIIALLFLSSIMHLHLKKTIFSSKYCPYLFHYLLLSYLFFKIFETSLDLPRKDLILFLLSILNLAIFVSVLHSKLK